MFLIKELKRISLILIFAMNANASVITQKCMIKNLVEQIDAAHSAHNYWKLVQHTPLRNALCNLTQVHINPLNWKQIIEKKCLNLDQAAQETAHFLGKLLTHPLTPELTEQYHRTINKNGYIIHKCRKPSHIVQYFPHYLVATLASSALYYYCKKHSLTPKSIQNIAQKAYEQHVKERIKDIKDAILYSPEQTTITDIEAEAVKVETRLNKILYEAAESEYVPLEANLESIALLTMEEKRKHLNDYRNKVLDEIAERKIPRLPEPTESTRLPENAGYWETWNHKYNDAINKINTIVAELKQTREVRNLFMEPAAEMVKVLVAEIDDVNLKLLKGQKGGAALYTKLNLALSCAAITPVVAATYIGGKSLASVLHLTREKLTIQPLQRDLVYFQLHLNKYRYITDDTKLNYEYHGLNCYWLYKLKSHTNAIPYDAFTSYQNYIQELKNKSNTPEQKIMIIECMFKEFSFLH